MTITAFTEPYSHHNLVHSPDRLHPKVTVNHLKDSVHLTFDSAPEMERSRRVWVDIHMTDLLVEAIKPAFPK